MDRAVRSDREGIHLLLHHGDGLVKEIRLRLLEAFRKRPHGPPWRWQKIGSISPSNSERNSYLNLIIQLGIPLPRVMPLLAGRD